MDPILMKYIYFCIASYDSFESLKYETIFSVTLFDMFIDNNC